MKFFLSIFIASLPSQGGVAEFQADDGHQRDGYYGCVGCGGSQNLTTDSPVLPFKHFIFVFECITGGWVTVAACSSGIQDSTLGLPLPPPCSSGTASSTKKGLDFRYFDLLFAKLLLPNDFFPNYRQRWCGALRNWQLRTTSSRLSAALDESQRA